MSLRKRKSEFPPEVLEVLRASPNLEPCDKFRNSNIVEFFEHLKEGKCRQCVECYLQWEKELVVMQHLRRSRN